jgi:hypothetical protein
MSYDPRMLDLPQSAVYQLKVAVVAQQSDRGTIWQYPGTVFIVAR